MESIGDLRGAFAFQFRYRGWKAQELMVPGILADFPNSLALGREDEADFQTFTDRRRNKVFSEEFPNAPIWSSLERYLRGGL